MNNLIGLMVSGYKIVKKINETPYCMVYRSCKDGSSENRIIKVLKARNPSESEVARFRQEYNIIRDTDIEGVIKTYDIIEKNGLFALVLEDFDGIYLKDILKNKDIDTSSFLDIAIQLSKALGELHVKKIVHKGIKPRNILINPTTGTVKITNFGITSIITHENDEIYNPEIVEGTLAYMSPEQTGRMNRTVDYRTDIYSLGVTLYEMLRGHVPFEYADPMEIMHAHIAKKPATPASMDKNIPPAISDIVMKLLSKTAEERYQNCFGLMADLQRCLDDLEETGSIEPFELAKKDISLKFNIPQKLFGREKEVELLLSTFEEVSLGQSRFMLVSGYPGIGKTALIHEVHKPIVAKRGYFISGKYEQFRRHVPYSSIIQAFQGLTRQILAESAEKVQIWREELLDVLGPNGQVITSVMPNIELIIGKQPDLPELPPADARNRFNMVFKNFTNSFAKQQHPLVLFLDDLQWADDASLHLIRTLITDPEIRHLFLIGSYRDTEVNTSHPLTAVLDNIKRAGVHIHSVTLSPLNKQAMGNLVAEFMRCDVSDSLPLARLIHDKTAGNPFFINQFMKTLYEEKMLEADPVRGWQWDMDKIGRMQVTDNVVDLMANKIGRLKDDTQEILKICACIGNRFDLEALSAITHKPIDRSLADLTDAIHEGLIGISEDIYVFSHDRIQEAAYSLISETKKAELHLMIGRLALKNTPKKDLGDNIFYIVNQLNQGSNLLNNKGEKDELSRLNLIAGKKAKKSAAYRQAFYYLKTGIDLMGKDSWDRDYDHTLSLYNEAAEAAYLSTEFDEMESLASEISVRARTILDKISIYKVRMATAMALGQPREASDIGLEFLGLLMIRFPKNPKNYHIAIDLIRTKIMLLGRSTKDLINRPAAKDPHALASINILTSIGPYLYFSDLKLVFLTGLRLMMLTLRHGTTPESPYAYVHYGGILCSVRDYESGYQFGKLALNLLEHIHTRSQSSKVIFFANTYTMHWKDHIRDTLKPLKNAHQLAMETGNLEYAAFSSMVYCYHSFYSGNNLITLEHELSMFEKIVSDLRHETSLNLIRINHQVVLNLIGNSEDPWRLSGKSYDEDNLKPGVSYYAYKLIICFLFGQYSLALENGKKAKRRIRGMRSTIHEPVLYFYDSLNRLSLYDNAKRSEKKDLLAKVRKNQRKMKKWAHYAPMNHLHRYTLVEAELNRVLGRDTRARNLYDTAIRSARDNHFVQDEALANELAAVFYLTCGHDFMARAYMNEACELYRKWGATAKVRDIRKRYPGLFKEKDPAEAATASNPEGAILEQLDLSSVLKSYQVISGEIVFSRLVEKLMHVVIENAGAQKGYLLLKENNALIIKAGINIEDSGKITSMSVPLNDSNELSHAVVNYVDRTMENIVLSDATNQGDYTRDPYILRYRPCSILCIPIVRHNIIIGVLYLENNATTGAFTRDRIEMLKLLSSQIAISIDNAGLYNELSKSEERYRTILESIEEGYYEVDLQGRFTFCNISLCRILGFSREEMEGLSYRECMDEKNALKVNEVIGRVFATGKAEKGYGWEIIKKDGIPIMVESSILVMKDSTGKSIGFRGVLRDISEKIQAENLKADKLVAEAKTKAKSDFLANMSHEIRTPLNGIIGMVELAMDTTLDENQKNIMRSINGESETLLNLINDILDFSKIEAEKYKLERTPFDLSALIEDLAHSFAMRSEKKGLEFITFLNPDIPTYLIGDPGKLRQVLSNLAGNALKFTEKGEVFIRVNLLEDLGDKVLLRFDVKDTGIGIPEQRLEKIFESFTQADDSTTRKYGGTGLGLTISRHIVEMMQGNIAVESDEGRGSTFSFTAQLGKQEDQGSEQTAGRVDLQGLRVLVVDDNETNRFIFTEHLKSWGCEPHVSAGGDESISILKASADQKEPFSLILMDFHMPDLNGIELTKKIRGLNHLGDIPVILLTSIGDKNDEINRDDSDIQYCLTKPTRRDDLQKAIISVMGLSRPNQDIEAEKPMQEHAISDNGHNDIQILLAEDYPTNQQVAMRHLHKAGFQVDIAENGQQAVSACKRKRYDIILMDIQMPVMDGYEATRLIREWERDIGQDIPAGQVEPTGRIPIIAMTAHAIEGYRGRCLDQGMDDYLTKPLRRKELIDTIDKWIF